MAPDVIITYNQIMGGVDLSDQNVACYDVDRKSLKWWKKVFYKLLMMTVVNAWIIYKEIKHRDSLPLKSFTVALAEQMVSLGKTTALIVRKTYSVPVKKKRR